MDETRLRRIAENESAFRDVNEHVDFAHRRFGAGGEVEFLCECGNPACAERRRWVL